MGEASQIWSALISGSGRRLFVQMDIMTSKQYWWVRPGMADGREMPFGEDRHIAYLSAKREFPEIDLIPWQEVEWSDTWPPPGY